MGILEFYGSFDYTAQALQFDDTEFFTKVFLSLFFLSKHITYTHFSLIRPSGNILTSLSSMIPTNQVSIHHEQL